MKELKIKILIDDKEVFECGERGTCFQDDDHLVIREAKRFLEDENDKILGNDKFIEYKEMFGYE